VYISSIVCNDSQALHVAAKQIKSQFPNVMIEASGGINENNITEYTGPNIDIISLGSATQGYGVVDFSFKICADGRDLSNPKVVLG
jgi:nicotinate-nucleotide pyrophosphorylase (carboxylating)